MTWAAIIKAVVQLVSNVVAYLNTRRLIAAGEDRARARQADETAARVARANRARLNADSVRDSDFRD